MTRFRVEDDFWALFPEARIGVVVAGGFDNSGGGRADVTARLARAIAAVAAATGDGDLSAHPAVAPWREAYRAFGVKPSKFRSSIEGLLRSAKAGRLGSVNPLVDLYNAVSLEHGLPCGGEDLATVRGDIHLLRARGGEHFVPLGSSEESPPLPGEIIYRDDEDVLCRCWNWREAERTKLTPATKDAFLCIETPQAAAEPGVRAACETLAAAVRETLGGAARVDVLTREHPETELRAH